MSRTYFHSPKGFRAIEVRLSLSHSLSLSLSDVLDLCDERRDLKKKRYEAKGAKEYREVNRRIQKAVKRAKVDWIGAQCEELKTCLNKNNSKRAHQLVKDLNSENQGRSSTIQEKPGKCLTEKQETDSQQMDIFLRTVQL